VSIIQRLPSTVISKVANLVRYPYLNNGGYPGTEKGSRQGIRQHSGSSPFGDWLTQTVTYHH
jgi:hypothetical protein